MVTIKLEEAFKLIPLFTLENDIYPFINACDMAVNLVEDKFALTLVKCITTRLCGRASEIIKYKNVTKWINIKNTTTSSNLQIRLNSIKYEMINEDVNDYYHRVEKLYYRLCTAYTINKEEIVAKVIHETLKEQTLVIFIKGLIGPIKTIVKTRNPKTLEVAKQLAKVEEVEFNSDRDNYRYRNDFSNNRDNYNFSLYFQSDNIPITKRLIKYRTPSRIYFNNQGDGLLQREDNVFSELKIGILSSKILKPGQIAVPKHFA
ncbi:myb-like protein D [Aphis craccivora]|uniref:Myb-like protein D n=1 Tax=Aphis craccivora TaxID=307492 RepID=A0A6G0Y8G2_APHCR|nr:myb-like protein D [Aphis craccivora]